MRFLNPKTDFAFKRIFGSAESREVLLSFLNAILGLQPPRLLVEVEILDPYLAPKIRGMKDTYLDVRAVDQQQRQFVIEMQVLNVAGFEKRILYNACKAYCNQLSRGEAYRELKEVIAITLTDFILFPPEADQAASGEVVTVFQLLAKQRATELIYSDDLTLVFAELPKFTVREGELERLARPLDKWFYFFKYAGELQAVPAPLQDPPLLQAFELANKAALTPEELEDQERRELFLLDQRDALEQTVARAEARAEARGLAEGRQLEQHRIARQLLAAGLDPSFIATTMGLTPEELQQLA